MQGNDTNIIIVTDKLKTFIGKLGLWVRKLERKSVETSDIGIDQFIKDHLVNLQSRFCKYFPEAVTDKYRWITDPFHADSPQNYNFSLEGNYIDIISDTPLKVRFHRKSYIEFWVRIGQELPHPSRKVLNNLLPFATSYLCKTGFSAMAANKTKYNSMSDHF
jgi:hypothetical protein